MTDAERRDADLLVWGIDWLITVDAERRILRDGAVAIAGGTFVDVGKTAELRARWEPRQRIDGRRRVATPGLIDGHLHSSFQLARGLADEVNAQAFLFDRMYPYEGVLAEPDVWASAALTAMELLRHGVTCFTDPGNYHPRATVDAVSRAGMRLVISRSTFDRTKSVMGLLPEAMIDDTERALEHTAEVLETYAVGRHERVTASASFRGLNNASDELIVGLAELARRLDVGLQTHACFHYSTRDSSIAQYGETEVARLERLGVLDERMLLVHGGWLSPEDIPLLAKRRPSIVAAASSSMHSGYGSVAVGRLPELMALGINVGIGSDHACSGIVDLPVEMLLLAGGYKEARLDARVLPPEQVVEMATINGAKAAGLADRIGSVEVGKQADLVLFDADAPGWQPLHNPISNLVYSATGATVDTMLVDGQVVVDDGHLTRLDENEVLREVAAAGDRLATRLDIPRMAPMRWPVS